MHLEASDSTTTARLPWGQDDPYLAWVRRCALIALLFGFVVACANVVALRLLELGVPRQEAQTMGGAALISAAGVTGAAYGLLGMAYGALTAPLCGWAWGQRLARLGAALLLSGALLANLVSAVLCFYSGSYLTIGALQFTFNSLSHVWAAALGGHGWTLVLLLGFAALVCWGLLALLRASAVTVGRRMAAQLPPLSLGLVASGSALAFDGFEQQGYRDAIWRATPELAFYSSVGRRLRGATATSEAAPAWVSQLREVAPSRQVQALWQATSHAPGDAPNVLLVVLESVGTRYLGYQGEPETESVTPNLDALARDGLRFERAWTTATHSNYAQMAILSSLVPRRGLGLDTYTHLDYPRVLFHDVFHHLGYGVATISSQDESWQGMARFQATGTPRYFFDARSYAGKRISIGSERVVPDHETVAHASDWIVRQQGRWALYVNLQATHFPYRLDDGVPEPFQPTRPTPGRFNYLHYPHDDLRVAINRYKNALAYVDRQIGRLRDVLVSSGQLERTLWVITSDHGELFYDHGLVTHGRTLYEPEARVPLILHWPGGIEPRVSREPVSTLDVLPTLLDAVGVAPHPAHQGRSALRSGAEPDRAILMNIQGLRSVEGIVCWPHKLTRDVASGRVSLFRLDVDPTEVVNVSAGHAQRTRLLERLLRAAMVAQDDYHRAGNPIRQRRFAPRVPRCPG